MPETRKIEPLLRSASFVPDSYNDAANTIDLIAATEEMQVVRYTWDGQYMEVLGMADGEVRLERLNSGANVLDNHNAYGSVRDTVIGVVERAWIQERQLHVTMRFSTRDDVKPIIADVRAGIIRNISIGYRVYKGTLTEEDGKVPVFRAEDWEPFEVSFVSVPADFMAGTRSANDPAKNEVIIFKNENRNTMPEKQPTPGATSAAEGSSESRQAPGQAAPAAPAGDQEIVRKEAAAAARQRSSEILRACRAANFDMEFAQQLIDDDKISVDQARAAILDKLAATPTQQQPTRAANAGITVSADETDKRRSGMENAILVRAGSSAGDKTKVGEYRGARLIDMARMSLDAVGVNTRGMSPRELAQAALNMDQSRAAFSTSDFPIILGNTVNRVLRKAYDLAPRTFQPWTRQTSANDFRNMTRAQFGDLATLDQIVEGAEYKSFSLSETGETYKVVKYGKIINLNWEMLVNDDLDAFSRIPQFFGNAAAQKQSDLVYNILTGNPNMADAVALFHATHGNLAAAGTVIDITNMGKARAALRKQTSLGGQFLNLTPKFLLVGPDKEQEALQITSSNYQANVTGNVNVWAGLVQPIIEARLTGNQWYLAADPSQIDTIETAFLDGEELYTEQRNGFEVDGMQIKARMVFGCKALDYRGLYKNPGA